MATRKRIWLNDPNLNYQNKRCLLVDAAFINDSNRLYEEDNTLFNYGDFVNAACVSLCPVAVLNMQPNYMVLMNGEDIESRWYVTNMQFISGEVEDTQNKWQMTLLRDVIVDNRAMIAASTMRLNRGNQSNFSDLRYKYDQLSFNEIKTDQQNIYDWAGPTQWLGVYYDPKVTDTTITWNRDNFIVSYTSAQIDAMLAGTGFTGSAATSFSGIKLNVLSAIGAEFHDQISATQTYRFRRDVALDVSGSDITYGNYKFYTVNNYPTKSTSPGSLNTQMNESVARFNADAWWNAGQGLISAYQINRVLSFNSLRTQLDGKYVSYPGGIIKRIRFGGDSTTTNTYNINAGSDQETLLFNLGRSAQNVSMTLSIYNGPSQYSMRYISQSIAFDVVSSSNITLELPRRTTLDESFVRFACIPLNTPVKANGITYATLANDVVSALVTNGFALAGTGGASFIKDIVRLPYCPIKPLNDLYSGQSSPTRSVIDLDALGAWETVGATITAPIKSGTTIIGYAIEESVSSQDYRLNNALNIQANSRERYYKKCRLRSPNHLSALDVSPANNLGITDISLSFTLRPLKTMYAVSPVWKGLYGQMFNDDRFNITEGGLSYTQVTDLWANYQLNNSTYQDIFNTGIKSMEYDANARMSANLLSAENSYNNSRIGAEASRERAIMSADLAAMQGFASAAGGDAAKGIMGVMGSMTARRSADVGYIATMQQAGNNLAMGRQQAAINDAMANNQIQAERDKFNLSNIAMRAAPTVMGRSSDFTVITAAKFYVEVYECLPIEKTFLDNFIRFNGELLEVITDDVKQYLVNEGDYLEGYCLYLPGLTPRMSEAVNAELRRGRYYALNIFA